MPLTKAEAHALTVHILEAQNLSQQTFVMIVDPNVDDARVATATTQARAANEKLVAFIQAITEK